MSKKAFESIAEGLREAIAHARSDSRAKSRVKIHRVKTGRGSASFSASDLKEARKQIGLTRDEFAEAFGLSAATLRKWENGERQPTGAARALLAIIAKVPETALRAISE